jgi:hypothetical protein
MARYIVIDSNSGFIFADVNAVSPEWAVIHADVNADGSRSPGKMIDIGKDFFEGRDGYEVRQAGVEFPIVSDGQNRELILLAECLPLVARFVVDRR